MPGDYLTAHHVCPVEARGFNPPPVGTFPCHHTYAALGSPGAGWDRCQTSHVVTHLVARVCLRLDICLHQEHNVEPPALYLPDGLHQSKDLAILDV